MLAEAETFGPIIIAEQHFTDAAPARRLMAGFEAGIYLVRYVLFVTAAAVPVNEDGYLVFKLLQILKDGV